MLASWVAWNQSALLSGDGVAVNLVGIGCFAAWPGPPLLAAFALARQAVGGCGRNCSCSEWLATQRWLTFHLTCAMWLQTQSPCQAAKQNPQVQRGRVSALPPQAPAPAQLPGRRAKPPASVESGLPPAPCLAPAGRSSRRTMAAHRPSRASQR